jgi:outer membrane lipoprotein LolB
MFAPRLRLFLALAVVSGLVGGCATTPERPPVADPGAAWLTRQKGLQALAGWELRGRVALRTRDDGWQASLVWTRQQDRHDIDLSGPLGSGHMRLTQDRHGAQLRDSANKVLHAADVESLLIRATGWRLPFDGLNYWVLGLPAPGASGAQDIDAWGRLRTLRQSGWDIEFLGYAEFAGTELPSKLFIRREQVATVAGETLEVRLVIDRWDLH